MLLVAVSALFLAVLMLTFTGEDNQTANSPSVAYEHQYWKVGLEELGFPSVSVPVSDETNRSEDIEIILPVDAQQGPDEWWILYTSFSIVLDPESGPGFAWVRAGTNGRISNQVSIESKGVGKGYFISRVELLSGPSKYFTLSPTHTHHMANYMQDRGVKAGKNDLRFSMQLSGDIRVKELIFHGDTQIIRIPLGPPKLEFEPIVEDGIFTKNEETLVDVDLHSLGWPVKNLIMRVDDADGAFGFRDPSPRMIQEITGSDTMRYHVTPLTTGEHELIFKAQGDNLGPLEGILTTDIKEPPMPIWPWTIIGALYLGVGLLLFSTARQFLDTREGVLSMVRQCRSFAWKNPVEASLLGIIPFAFLSILLQFFHYNVYGQMTPGVLMGAITVLYLALAMLLGFIAPLRAASVGPVLGYPAFVLLWPLFTGLNYDSITYDSGWVGGLLFKVLIPAGIIWLFVCTGHSLGLPRIRN